MVMETAEQKFLRETEYRPEECAKMFSISCYIPKDSTGEIFFLADDEGNGTFADEVGADQLKEGLDQAWEDFRAILVSRAELAKRTYL